MQLYIYLIDLLILLTCSSKEVSIENKQVAINQQNSTYINNINDTEAISTLIINASIWYEEQKKLWQLNKAKREDSIRPVLVNNIISSGYFSDKMIGSIQSNSTKSKYGEYYFGYELGRLLKSFSTKDQTEIIRNLNISGDSAIYTTNFFEVLNEVPSNDDRYTWLIESGANNERWLFAIKLIKVNGNWKIDQFERMFKVYIR